MRMERTLAIIKPDAISRGLGGEILNRLEGSGFKVLAMKMARITKDQARGFYIVHADKSFYESLTHYISSGPCIAMVLEKDNAIKALRDLMGATDPAKAVEGTIRKKIGIDIERNSIHGSDSPESAAFEIPYFFSSLDICAR